MSEMYTCERINNIITPQQARLFYKETDYWSIILTTESFQPLPIKFPGVGLPARGDIGMTDDGLDLVAALDICDEDIHRAVLLVGVARVFGRDHLDADGEVIYVFPAVGQLGRTGMIGDIRFIDEAVDRARPIDQIMRPDPILLILGQCLFDRILVALPGIVG